LLFDLFFLYFHESLLQLLHSQQSSHNPLHFTSRSFTLIRSSTICFNNKTAQITTTVPTITHSATS
jgi:hypothetical protein